MTDDDRQVELEDRLREKAPASDMWGEIAWVEGVPRFVRDRYRTGGAPTKSLAARPSTTRPRTPLRPRPPDPTKETRTPMQDHNAQPTAIEDVTALSDDELRQRISTAYLDGNDADRLATLRAERTRRERDAYIKALYDIADFLRNNPQVPVATSPSDLDCGPRFGAVSGDVFLAAVEALDATVAEVGHNGDLEAVRQFGPIRYYVRTRKADVACEQREVSRTEYVMPDALRQRMADATTKRLRSAA